MNHEDLEITLDKELEEMILLEAVENKIDDELNSETSLNKEADEEKVQKKKKRKKFSSKKLKSVLNIRTLLVLLLTLIVNTYAWFIYISTASTGLNVHVKSWEFEFSTSDTVDDIVVFEDNLYPGMKEVKRTIKAQNKGETAANISYTITSLKLFDEELLGENEYIDPEEFETIIERYPFDIQIQILSNGETYDSSKPMKQGDIVEIEFLLNWEYERKDADGSSVENDIEDTIIGKKAYEYYNYKIVDGEKVELTDQEKQERNNAIEIVVHIEAKQTNSDVENSGE